MNRIDIVLMSFRPNHFPTAVTSACSRRVGNPRRCGALRGPDVRYCNSLFEELQRVAGPADEGEAAVGDQDDAVEAGQQVGGRLVDGAEDGLAARRHLQHQLHQLLRRVRVQPRGRLVAEQQRRVRQQLRMRTNRPSTRWKCQENYG